MSTHPVRRHARLLSLLPLAGSLGACSSFYDTYPTAASAAWASMRQQQEATSYRVQSEVRLEDVELSESLQELAESLMGAEGEEILASGEAGTALGAAREALRGMAGKAPVDASREGEPATRIAKPQQKPADGSDADADEDMLAGIAADNRELDLLGVVGNLGSGYLHMLRNIRFQGDTVVDGGTGRIEHVSGMDYRTRTTSQSYHMPFLVDVRNRQLYWDAEAISMLMNPVTRDKPIRIGLGPLNRKVDAMKLYGILRQQRSYALEHADAGAIGYEPLEDGPQVPGAYRKIRYQVPLRTALLQNRNFLRDNRDGIVQTVREDKNREKVGQLLDVLVGMGGGLQKPSQATAAAAQLPDQADTPAMDRLSGDSAPNATPDATVSAESGSHADAVEDAPGSLDKIVARTLDDSTITQWLWLDRRGRLLREDKRYDLHLGDEEDYVKVKTMGSRIYGDVPSGPVARIQPEQAVSLREAVKGSLMGYMLASMHDDVSARTQTDDVAWAEDGDSAHDAAVEAAEAAVTAAQAALLASEAADAATEEQADGTVASLEEARAAYAAARAEQAVDAQAAAVAEPAAQE